MAVFLASRRIFACLKSWSPRLIGSSKFGFSAFFLAGGLIAENNTHQLHRLSSSRHTSSVSIIYIFEEVNPIFFNITFPLHQSFHRLPLPPSENTSTGGDHRKRSSLLLPNPHCIELHSRLRLLCTNIYITSRSEDRKDRKPAR